MLRSFVTGLACRHAPDDVAFVLIDYKGGAAFAGCSDFPHTVGLVTDLDNHLTSRALISLTAEIRRREAAFAEAGVAELDAYRRSPQSRLRRLPRLILVVDEFAYLSLELPNFLSGLIGIAQRGRSLGLHLVLATQRPAGVLSPEIKANISLRIALRVTDPAESQDVIGVEAACHISKTQPGRGFARLADGLVEFHTARTGPRANHGEAASVIALDAWNRAPAPNGGTDDLVDCSGALCSAMTDAVAALGRPLPERPWLAALPDSVTVAELQPAVANRFEVRFGLVDDPDRQRQFPAAHDLRRGGSIGFIGDPRSGRTTALHSFLGEAAGQLGSDQLHLYVLDCSGRGFGHVAGLPHCGATVERDDPRSVGRLITRLIEELGWRQRALADRGVTTLAEAHLAGELMPVIVFAIDGWEGLVALSDECDAGRSVEAVLRLLRDGAAVGITVLIAGGRAMLGLRIAPALTRKLLLALNDRGDYITVGLNPASLPVTFPPGRAVGAEDGLEVQLALLVADASSGAQRAALQRIVTKHPVTASAPTISIRALPESISQAEVKTVLGSWPEVGTPRTAGRIERCLLGVGGDEAAPVSAALFAAHARFLVAGPPRSGRSTTALVIGSQALAAGLVVLVAAPPRSPLAAWASRHRLSLVTPEAARSDDALDTVLPHATDLILVDDSEQFQDRASGQVLTEAAKQHRAAMVVTARTDDLMISFRGVAVEVRRHRTGLLLHAGVADGELLGIRIAQQLMATSAGRGLLVTDETRANAPDGLLLQVAI